MGPDDAESVAQVHVKVWQTAYEGLLVHDYLASLEVSNLTDQWSRRLLRKSPRLTHVVGLRPDGSIAAAGTSGPPRDRDEPAPMEIYGLIVLAQDHGTGLADLMMQRLTRGRPCSLWVLEGNTRAIAFYRAHGFRMDHHTPAHPPTGATDLRMVRRRTT